MSAQRGRLLLSATVLCAVLLGIGPAAELGAEPPDAPSALDLWNPPGSLTGRLILSSEQGSERRLPGDWEPPEALFIANTDYWTDSLVPVIRTALSDTQLVIMSDVDVLPEVLEKLVRSAHSGAVAQFSTNHDSPWVRDYGPVLVWERDQPVWLDFTYRDDRYLDDQIPEILAGHFNVTLERISLHLDGGGLISNGRGLCAMTDVTLGGTGINRDEEQAVQWLLRLLGCRAMAVLPALPDEETGHADMMAQFLGPELVAVSRADAERSPGQAAALDGAVKTLLALAKSAGQRLEVVRLPMYIADENFYSYVNGTRLKKHYLVPSYTMVPSYLEAEAYVRLQEALPAVELIPVPADSMIELGGAVHCITVGLGLRRATHRG